MTGVDPTGLIEYRRKEATHAITYHICRTSDKLTRSHKDCYLSISRITRGREKAKFKSKCDRKHIGDS